MRLPVSRTQKLIVAAVLCAVALSLSLLDQAVSSLIPVLPGFKIGLANIVTLFALYAMGLPYAALICLARSLLTAVFGGNLTMLLFSLTGGLVSMFAMWLCMRHLSVVKCSVTGGVVHNLCQLLVALLVTGTPQVVVYLPPLAISGAICGFFMGVLCTLLLRRLPLFHPQKTPKEQKT